MGAHEQKDHSRRYYKEIFNTEAWQTDAACNEADPEIFYASTLRGTNRVRQEREAKEICAGCPVINECLDFALRAQDDQAILGGTTPLDRQQLRSIA